MLDRSPRRSVLNFRDRLPGARSTLPLCNRKRRRLTPMEPSTPQHDSPQLWVGLGRFDFPVQLQLDLAQLDLNKKPRFVMDFSRGTGDGYFEFRPLDFERASTRSWWSRDEPVLFEFRASVVAALPNAVRRASTFVEHCLDWLSLFHGVAAADPNWIISITKPSWSLPRWNSYRVHAATDWYADALDRPCSKSRSGDRLVRRRCSEKRSLASKGDVIK